MPLNTSQQRPQSDRFQGFEPLTANYLYCPNQFFDVCLPNCSRGAVRIVAYILRQTLGWLDVNGNPRQQNIVVTYRDLIQKAGVSRGAIAPAIKEAVSAGFLICSQQGNAKSVGNAGQSATYVLRWTDSDVYTTNLEQFTGFFAGGGNRTPIPNSFFDELVGRESLAVLKVVGTVLRHTVGYQNQFGRRQVAPLSYQYISQYAQLSQGRVLAQAIQTAIQSGFIECVVDGTFAAKISERQAAQYRVRWLTNATQPNVGSKKPPVETTPVDRFKNTTNNRSKTPSAERFNKAINRKTETNNTVKQQNVAVEEKGIRLLLEAGLDRKTAQQLAANHDCEQINNQLLWLDARKPKENRLGMLRKSIEENWSQPKTLQSKEVRQRVRLLQKERTATQRAEDAAILKKKQLRNQHRKQLLAEWGSATIEERERWIREAAKREASSRLAEIIRRETPETMQPKVQILDVLALERKLIPIAAVSGR